MTKVQLKPISLYDLLVEKEALADGNAIDTDEMPEYITKAFDWVRSHYDEQEVNYLASEFDSNVEEAKAPETIQLSDLDNYANEMGTALNYECNVPTRIQVEISVPTKGEEETKDNPFREGWIIIRSIEKGAKPIAKVIYAGAISLYTRYDKLPDRSTHEHYEITFPESGYNGPDNEIDFDKCHDIVKTSENGTDTIVFTFASVNETENRPDDLITILEICDCIDY